MSEPDLREGAGIPGAFRRSGMAEMVGLQGGGLLEREPSRVRGLCVRVLGQVSKNCSVCFVALMLAFAAPGSASEQQRRQALASLQLELVQLNSELEAVRAQSEDVVGRVARIRKELEIQRLRVDEAQQSMAIAVEGVAEAEQRLTALAAQSAKVRERLGSRSGALYRLGRWGTLRLMLSLQQGADAPAGVRALRALVRRDAQALAELAANQAEADRVRGDLVRQQAEARSWLDQQRRRSRELRRQEGRAREALVELRDRRGRIESEVESVGSRHSRLTRLLELIAQEGGGGLGGLPLEDFKGALDWPVRGAVRRGFGAYRDPQYGTMVPHNGISVEAALGTSVQVAYPGRVVYAGAFRDIGLVAVVQHSRDALTLYSGLRQVQVEEGEVLSLGDSVGFAAREVYFELRISGVPQDPRDWLQ